MHTSPGGDTSEPRWFVLFLKQAYMLGRKCSPPRVGIRNEMTQHWGKGDMGNKTDMIWEQKSAWYLLELQFTSAHSVFYRTDSHFERLQNESIVYLILSFLLSFLFGGQCPNFMSCRRHFPLHLQRRLRRPNSGLYSCNIGWSDLFCVQRRQLEWHRSHVRYYFELYDWL